MNVSLSQSQQRVVEDSLCELFEVIVVEAGQGFVVPAPKKVTVKQYTTITTWYTILMNKTL